MNDYTKGIIDIIFHKSIQPKFSKGEVVEITDSNMMSYLNNTESFFNNCYRYVKSGDTYYFFSFDYGEDKLVMTSDFINYYVSNKLTNIGLILNNDHKKLTVYNHLKLMVHSEYSLLGSVKDGDKLSRIFITEDYHIIVEIINKLYYVLPNK